MEPDLDIVIPVYNEGENIIGVLESLRAAVRTPFRVLICYDRPEDSTLSAIAAYPMPDVDIQLVQNTGKGAFGAVMTGFRESTAPAAIVIPADDDYNAPKLDQMVEKFREGYDIVCASRFIPGGCMRGCPWLKAFLVRTSAFMLYHLAKLPTRDPSNGFRLFSRRVLQSIPVESSMSFAYSIELLVKAHRLRWKIAEVPVEWHERKQGSSRFHVLAWLPQYLIWFRYAFATTYLSRGPETVRLNAVGQLQPYRRRRE